jgi:hypothetical protein
LVLDFPCHEQQSESTADRKFQTKHDPFLDQEMCYSLALETVTSLQGEKKQKRIETENKQSNITAKNIHTDMEKSERNNEGNN